MPNSFVRVAPDSTGKALRTVSSTVDGVEVHEQVTINTSPRVRLGQFVTNAGAYLVQQNAHAATAGFWWLINPVGSGIAIAIRRVKFSSQLGSALVTATSPRITLERFTFTGTATGASITPAKRVRTAIAGETADANPVGRLLTASTGLTITAGETLRAFFPVACGTAVGFTAPAVDEWYPVTELGQVILAPGEGLVCRQPDAGGVASDTRRVNQDLTWEEYSGV